MEKNTVGATRLVDRTEACSAAPETAAKGNIPYGDTTGLFQPSESLFLRLLQERDGMKRGGTDTETNHGSVTGTGSGTGTSAEAG